ncbi:MAG: DUF58 domain-containing protein [Planctomycetes bacterium]|nr:DUF58 domain-containing protein [Planctomycetota bacterium]
MRELFDAGFLRRLEQLALVSRRIFQGRLQGERRSPRRGTGVEFADFRPYTQGDDFRRIDWNAYARLDDLYLRLFLEEEELAVYLLVDASASMDVGEPVRKFDHARRVLAALGYVALAGLERVQVAAVGRGPEGGGRVPPPPLPLRNRHRFATLLEHLGALRADGAVDLAPGVDAFLGRSRRRGLVLVASDLLTPDPLAPLGRLRAAGHEPFVLHVLAPEEVDPAPGGEHRLVDAETGLALDISMNAQAVRGYRRRLEALSSAVSGWCRRHGVGLLRTVSSEPFEETVLRSLRLAGALR